MKKILLCILILCLFPFTSLFAQEDTVTESQSEYFELSLEKFTQSAFDKSIQYIITITPLIDSPRTQILWEAPLSFTVNEKHSEFVNLEIDQTYTFKANLKPSRAGTYDISVSVVSWQYDTNYTNTVSDTVVLNDSLLVEPIFTEYIVGKVIIVVVCLLLSGAAIWGAIILVKRGLKGTKKWLTPPA